MSQKDAKIVHLYEADGITPIAPRTHATAVTYGDTNLADALKAVKNTKQDNIKDSVEKTDIEDNDLFAISDSSESAKTKNTKFSTLRTKIKEYTDALYNKTTIVNNLAADTEGSALDAVQGKILDNKIATAGLPAVSSGTGSALSASLPGRNLIDRLVVRLRLHEDIQDGATLDFNGTGANPILYSNKDPISAWAKAGSSINIEYNLADQTWYLLGNVQQDTPQSLPQQVVNYKMLYYCGDECGSETGGWNAITLTGTSKLSKHPTFMEMYGQRTYSCETTHQSIIDFSTFAKVSMVIDVKCESTLDNNWLDIMMGSQRAATYKTMQKGMVSFNATNGNKLTMRMGTANGDVTAKIFSIVALKNDDYNPLLRAAGITATYADCAALAADTTAMATILGSERAVRILAHTCTGDLMTAILQSSAWITTINANETARRILMSNPHWAKFIAVIPSAEPLLRYTMLYDQGDECESKTGGWDKYDIYSAGTRVMVKNSYNMVLSLIEGGSTSAFSASAYNKIDLSKYKTLHVISDYCKITGTSAYTFVNVAANKNLWNSVSTREIGKGYTESSDSKITSLDLSGINEQLYPRVTLDSGRTSGTVDTAIRMVWVEKSDPYQPWLTAAGITKSFSNIDAILADSATLSLLMSNEAAIEYMISCSGTLMAAVCQSQAAMTALCNNIAYDKAFDNPWWYKFMTMCPISLEAMDAAPSAVRVPTMTSNTAPSGESFANYEHTMPSYTYEAYKAFNKIITTGAAADGGDSCWSGNNSAPYVGYDFDKQVCIYKAIYSPRRFINGQSQNLSKYYYEYSDDKVSWFRASADIVVGSKADATDKVTALQQVGFHRYWRVNCLSNFGENLTSVNELQFYGKAVN